MSVSGREATVSLRVHPNAPKNEVVGFAGGVLRVKIAAPPVKGKANRELIVFLSQLLGVSRGALTIIQGHTSTSKIITIAGLNQEEVIKRIFPVKPV
jgi:uncharacterized protein (TIGR00251 family)